MDISIIKFTFISLLQSNQFNKRISAALTDNKSRQSFESLTARLSTYFVINLQLPNLLLASAHPSDSCQPACAPVLSNPLRSNTQFISTSPPGQRPTQPSICCPSHACSPNADLSVHWLTCRPTRLAMTFL